MYFLEHLIILLTNKKYLSIKLHADACFKLKNSSGVLGWWHWCYSFKWFLWPPNWDSLHQLSHNFVREMINFFNLFLRKILTIQYFKFFTPTGCIMKNSKISYKTLLAKQHILHIKCTYTNIFEAISILRILYQVGVYTVRFTPRTKPNCRLQFDFLLKSNLIIWFGK